MSCLCFFFGSASYAAATRAYQVDMLVFKNTASSPSVSQATSLPAQSHLKLPLARLKASHDYEVLFSESFITELKTGIKQTVQINNGSISFVLGYYLDIDLHLDIPPTYFDEKLKANSQQLLYIDRPDYGVLLYLSPVEPKHVA